MPWRALIELWSTWEVWRARKKRKRVVFQGNVQAFQGSAHRVALMTKTDLIFPAFSSRYLNLAAQFCFRCKFSFHEERARVRFG